jgi:hypothetical protein
LLQKIYVNVKPIKFSKTGHGTGSHCERSAAIHVFGAPGWIATAYGRDDEEALG